MRRKFGAQKPTIFNRMPENEMRGHEYCYSWGACEAHQVGALGVVVHGDGRHQLDVEEACWLRRSSLWAATDRTGNGQLSLEIDMVIDMAAPCIKEMYFL